MEPQPEAEPEQVIADMRAEPLPAPDAVIEAGRGPALEADAESVAEAEPGLAAEIDELPEAEPD